MNSLSNKTKVNKNKEYVNGLKDGIPIGLGYLAVSFTVGISAVVAGMNWWQATLMSMVVLTSAGQLAGINMMGLPNMHFDILVSQVTINVRYSFMSIALSQKTDSKFKGIFKFLLGFFITDEIFAVAVRKKNITRSYFLGLGTLPYFGWALGTLLGAILGDILPEMIVSALCIAIYGMFIASVVPTCKKETKTLIVVLLTIGLSCIFYYVPYFENLSSGISTSICAVAAATLGAILFPRNNSESKTNSKLDEEVTNA